MNDIIRVLRRWLNIAKQIDHRNLSRLANTRRVLQELFNQDETSRAEIARNLKLNKSTVSSIYNDLDRQGFIEELRVGSSTNNGGRKPKVVRLDRNYGFVASFNIGTSHLTSMFNFINGELIQYNRETIADFDILSIMQMVKQALLQMQAADDTKHGLLGIGFSIHGIVNDNKIIDSPFLQLQGIDLKQYFEHEFHVPVVIENEANLSATFEHDFYIDSSLKDIISISIHRGIGMGVITNGHLYRGFRGMAGEIGRTLTNAGQSDSVEHWVKVESLCSEDVILDQVRAVVGESTLAHRKLADLYRQNPAVQAIFQRAARLLAEVTYNAEVCFGPQEVFFNATLLENVPQFYDDLKAELRQLDSEVPVKMIKGSRLTSLYGCASLSIHHILHMDGYHLRFKLPQEIRVKD